MSHSADSHMHAQGQAHAHEDHTVHYLKVYAALGGVGELASIGYSLTLFWH